MIDRKSRNEMANAIRSYMNDEISAFQFDDILFDIDTKDNTVKEIGNSLWYYYDDLKDHKIVACKEEWDLFNRLLLLLESDGEIKSVKKRIIWSVCNGIAALLFLSFVFIILKTGWGEHLLIFSIPFGVVSMVICWFNCKAERKRHQHKISIAPYPSIQSLFYIRRSVPNFKKIRYPKEISNRKIRNIVIEKIMLLPMRVIWLMFAPIVLFFQIRPAQETEAKIQIPEQGAV